MLLRFVGSDDTKQAAIWALAEKLADMEMIDEVSPFIPIAEILVAALEAEGLRIARAYAMTPASRSRSATSRSIWKRLSARHEKAPANDRG